jgi:hypothetical protein
MSLNLIDLDLVRDAMIAEIDHDIDAGTLYRSTRLSPAGWVAYPDLLKTAASMGDSETLAHSLANPAFWNMYEEKPSPKGNPRKVPRTANETLAESEFNRFYLRGLCREAEGRGIPAVEVYRAKAVYEPRPESQALIGTLLTASQLLNDLRIHIGIDTALGLPPGPNSGLSGRFPT